MNDPFNIYKEHSASILSFRYNIDQTQVEEVIKRTREIDWYFHEHDTKYSPLEVALLEKIDRKKAIQIFDIEDLKSLRMKTLNFDHFFDVITPVFYLKEIALFCEQTIKYCIDNFWELLLYGNCPLEINMCIQSTWFNLLLSRLYSFKLNPKIIIENENISQQNVHKFGKTVSSHDLISEIESAKNVENLLNDSNFVLNKSVWPNENEVALFVIRLKLLITKINILKILQKAAIDHDCTHLWKDCLAIFTKSNYSLEHDEVNILFKKDHIFTWNNFSRKENIIEYTQPFRMIERPGGISDIFEIIGFVEKEITIGTMRKTKEALGCLYPKFNDSEFNIYRYFHLIGTPEQELADAAIDLFLSLDEKERHFWREYERRVNESINSKFEVPTPYGGRVKKQDEQVYESYMRYQSEYFLYVLERKGVPPNWSEPSEKMADNDFRTMKVGVKNYELDCNQVDREEFEGLKEKNERLESENRIFQNERIVLTEKIIKYKKRQQTDITKEQMVELIDKTRKKNGKQNYSKIGKEIGRNHETVKKYITNFGLSDY